MLEILRAFCLVGGDHVSEVEAGEGGKGKKRASADLGSFGEQSKTCKHLI